MKNFKIQLMALGLCTVGVSTVTLAVENLGEALMAPISEKFAPVNAMLGNADEGVGQVVAGMKNALTKLGTIIAQVKANIQNQVTPAAQDAQKLWGAGTQAVAGIVPSVKSQAEATSAVNTLQRGLAQFAEAANRAASNLRMVGQFTPKIQDGLNYVDRGTGPMEGVGNGIRDFSGKLHDAFGKLAIKSLESSAGHMGHMGIALAEVAHIITALKTSMGDILVLIKSLADQLADTCGTVGHGAETVAKA